MVKGKKQWALIWWIDEHKKDVIELNKMKVNDRRVDCLTKLKWGFGKNASYSKAKVIAIGEDPAELDGILLTEEGTIIDSSSKIFTHEVISTRKDLVQQEKMLESIKKCNQRKRDSKIKSDSSIFDRFTASSAKKPRKQTGNDQGHSKGSEAYDEIKKIEPTSKSSEIIKCRSASVGCEPAGQSWSQSQVVDVQSLQRNASYGDQSSSSQYGEQLNPRLCNNNFYDVPHEFNENNLPPRAGMGSNMWHQDPHMLNTTGQIQNHRMMGYQGYNGYGHHQNSQNPNYMSSLQLQYPMRSQSIGPQPTYGSGIYQTNYYPQNASMYQNNWAESFGSNGGQYSAMPNPTTSIMSHNNPPQAAELNTQKLSLTQESQNKNDKHMELSSANDAQNSVRVETGKQDETTVLTSLDIPQSMVRDPILKFNQSSLQKAPSYSEVSNENGQGPSDFIGSIIAPRESLEAPKDDLQNVDQRVADIVTTHCGKRNNDKNAVLLNMSYNLGADRDESSKIDENESKKLESTENGMNNESPSSPERYPDPLDDDWREDTEDDASEDAESSDKENMNHAAQAFVNCLSKRASKDFIECQRYLLALLESNMQKKHYKEKKSGGKGQIHSRLNEKYYKPGENKVEIYPGCGFYLDASIISYAEMMAKDENDDFQWKVLVDEILLEVYGSDLADYCALGRSGVRSGICRHLLMGLYKWFCQRSQATGDIVEKKIFIKHINKKASNKR